MRKLKLIVVSSLFILLILTGTLTLANTDNSISDFFEQKNKKLEKIDENEILVEGENFTITTKEYIELKENLSLVNELNGVSYSVSSTNKSEDIMNRLIERKLILQFAAEENLKVTDDEVMEYALQTEEARRQNSTPELEAILAELAKSLDITPEEYFTHPVVLEQYRDFLLINKVIDSLYEQNKINHNEYTFEDFKADLRESKRGDQYHENSAYRL